MKFSNRLTDVGLCLDCHGTGMSICWCTEKGYYGLRKGSEETQR